MIDPTTGEVFWRRCRSFHCSFCLPVQARQRAAAVALARPTHLLTLTRTGADFPAIRKTVNRFRELCCRLGGAFEWFWVAEYNPRRTGTHVHAWLRPTTHLGVKVLSDAAGRAGLGSVLELEEARGLLGPTATGLEGVGRAGYVLKEALVSPANASTLSDAQAALLSLNGDRLGHSSRGFWLDRFGRRLSGVREAEREALRMRRAHRHNPIAAVGSASPGKAP